MFIFYKYASFIELSRQIKKCLVSKASMPDHAYTFKSKVYENSRYKDINRQYSLQRTSVVHMYKVQQQILKILKKDWVHRLQFFFKLSWMKVLQW